MIMKVKARYILILMATFVSGQVLAQKDITVYDDQTGNEERIDLPEGMLDNEIDSMMHRWSSQTYLTCDTSNCRSKDEVVTFPAEVYIRRLQNLPNVIEMPYNSVVRKFIDQYGGRLRRSVAMMLGAGNFYIPIFEEALESYQIPLELKYLPVIESALNPGATSRVGAAGLWQFMIGTGKKYGLEITSLIDERRDPVKASYAAARYLKDLYGIFGDWTLVIAAYNCGPSNVSKAIKRAGGERDYWRIYPYLPKETRGYVPAFIAANYMMNYYCDHNICPAVTRLPLGTDTIQVNRDVYMEQVSAVCGMSMDELRALNPQYRTSKIPGAAHVCTLRMPTEQINMFLESGDSVYTYRSEEMANMRSVAEVAEVKENSYYRSRHRSSRSSHSRQRSQSVTIKSGDNLGAIAQRNHTTVAKLRQLNGIKGDNIRAGEKLRVR